MDSGTRNLVVAAGGLLWRRAQEGLQCAIVFRRRYQGEPGLPKGKVQPGESLERAALREVEEETGCEAITLSYAGSMYYTYNNTDKVVFLWNMAAKGESSFRPSEEVERVAWLTPEVAIETLIHPEEKKLLSRASQTVGERTSVGVLGWIRGVWIKTVASARSDRLEGTLRVAQVEIERRVCARLRTKTDHDGVGTRGPSALPQELCWADAAQNLLSEAKAALVQGRIDQGWRLLHAARRMEILAIDAKTELPALAAALRAESDKLKTWRQKTVQELLGTSEKPKHLIGVDEVYQAALIRDEHYNNQGYKDGLVRTQILSLVLLLGVAMAGLLGLAKAWDQSAFNTFVAVALFGFLGGTVSAMLRASDTSQSARIPELTAAIRVTFMRILMGSASAVVVYVFLKSQLTSVFSKDIADAMKSLEPYTTYAVAFVAGFSERLVLQAVEHVAGKEQGKGKETPKTP